MEERERERERVEEREMKRVWLTLSFHSHRRTASLLHQLQSQLHIVDLREILAHVLMF